MIVPYTCIVEIFTLEKSTVPPSHFNENISNISSTTASTVSTKSRRSKVSQRAKKKLNRQIIQSEPHWTDEWIRCETEVESIMNLEKARKLL